jgi:hypothetical protein
MRTSVSAVVLTAALSLSLTACGSNNTKSATNGANTKADVKPVAALTNLTGESTAVKLDPMFVAGITSLKLTPGVVGTAKLTDGSLIFPITGGTATYYTPGSRTPYVESKIMHDGSGFSLTDGKTKVELTNFVVDAGTSTLTGDVSANGASVVKGAKLFFLDGRTLKPLDTTSEAGKGILAGTKVELTKDAADLLNKTYKVTALKPFFPVGVAKITLALPAK